jgi:deoxyribodipyrimidine photo-lyase
MRSLIWFRSDLRVNDNSALHAATRNVDQGVIAAFVISPEEWKSHDVAPVKVHFILRTLRELSAALARLNIPLVLSNAGRAADVPGVLLKVATAHGCNALYFNREYEVDESRRDAATEALFNRHGIAVHSSTDQVIIAPGELRTREGRSYTIFTPFRKAWIAALAARGAPVLPQPGKQHEIIAPSSTIPDSIPGFTSNIDPALWPAGESAAAGRLSRFVERRIARYKIDRDLPALESTSCLSPYLSVGALSPRQCLAAAIAANPTPRGKGPLDSGNDGIQQWITELIWREFYTHILHGFPRVCMGRAFKPATERLPWSDDKSQFDAWKTGRTGVPIVDAAMRQLRSTGWMHNRLRMITAMYLTKDPLHRLALG